MIAFVLSEHAHGLTPDRSARYEEVRARLASVLGDEIESVSYEEVESPRADALVLSGSTDPWALHDRRSLGRFYEELRRFPGPILGICAGMQMLVRSQGGVVAAAAKPVRGFGKIDVVDDTDLLAGLEPRFEVFRSHEDEVTELPAGFRVLASSQTCAVEVVAAEDRPWWGTQFHPEEWTEEHPAGREIIARFGELAGISASVLH